MALTNDEAMVLFAVIKELEAKGVNVDYIRNIGKPILDSFEITEEQLDAKLNYIKSNS